MGERIRILHVAQAAGGVDRYLRAQLKYMDHNKFENIAVFSQDFKPDDYKGLIISYEEIAMKREISLGDFYAVKKLRDIIKKYNPDIVYAHSSKAGAISRIANVGMKSECIYNPHGWAFNMRCTEMKRKSYVTIEKMAAPFCKKIICISSHEKESALTKKICKEDKLELILNGIDIEWYDNYTSSTCNRKTLGISDDAIIVGAVGRLCAQKAPDVFIRAAKRIKESIPNAFFILVGKGEYETEIINYARENNLENSLLITGWVENPMSYIKLFDVAMLLSRWEGFGLVLPEYMIAQKPIVASNVGGITEIISDHENGILVNPGDVEGVYQAVMEILADFRLKTEMTKRAYRDVHVRFDIKRVAKEHEALIEKMLAQK